MRMPILMLAALSVAATATPVVAQTKAAAAPSPAIAKALADPARADQAGDDVRRQAAAVLAFSGVKPGWTVVDYLPGGGYWTRLFSPIVGPKGQVYAVWPPAAAKYAEKQMPPLVARNLPNVSAALQTTPRPSAPKPVDLFWTVQNYHDLPAGYLPQFNAAVFRLLKSGGIYMVIDHADAAGPASVPPKHRIDPAVVKSQVTAAGFTFVGSIDVLRNPADDHSRPVFDPAIRGKTDQFVYKFRKP